MRIRNNYVEKWNVSYVLEGITLQEAYVNIETTGYRCIPVLTEDKQHFVGNIYKVDIIENIFKNKLTMGDSIDSIIKNKDSFISEEVSIFKAFFTIKALPFIAVVDETNHFKGILTHAKVMELLEDAYGFKKGGYVLTLVTSEYSGSLRKIIKIINKYSNIEALLTLDQGNQLFRRIIVTLPGSIDGKSLRLIRIGLNKIGTKILIEDKITK